MSLNCLEGRLLLFITKNVETYTFRITTVSAIYIGYPHQLLGDYSDALSSWSVGMANLFNENVIGVLFSPINIK